jgi:hypothetical protein
VGHQPTQLNEKGLHPSNGHTYHNSAPQSWPKEQPPIPNGHANHDLKPLDTPGDRLKSSVGDELFLKQAKDWFVGGRYFKIQPGVKSEESDERQGKEFILLDWRNNRGEAVRVDTIDEARWSTGMRRTMTAVSLPGAESNPGYPTIFLEEVGRRVRPEDIINRFAQIDVTETAAFDRYPCMDLGILKEDSLDKIREQWLLLRAKQWHVSPFPKK